MKKIVVLVLMIVFLGSLAACKKETKNPEQTEEPQATTDTNETIEKTDEPTETGTITKDVYVDQTTEQTNDGIDYSAATGTIVTDEVIKNDLQLFVEKFYFNYLFKTASPEGVLTEGEMQLFAISYIYQFEHQELTFDASSFVLYIPEERVSEVIERFFDVEFTNHRFPEETNITYENGYYLMPARDDAFGTPPVITQIMQISDFDYKIFFEGNAKYEAVIEDREGRYILVNFKKIDPNAVVEVTPAP